MDRDGVAVRVAEGEGAPERAAAAPQGRALPTELTDTGREILTAASRAVAGVEQQMTQALTAERRQRLLADLTACVAALDPS